MRLSKLKYVAIGIVALVVSTVFLFSKQPARIRCFAGPEGPTLSTVAYDCFVQFVPLTGVIEMDASARCHSVKVPVDELYLTRIVPGRIGKTTFNNKDYTLTVTNVDPTVMDGRFNMEMNFCDEVPPNADGAKIRLRIQLSDSSTQLLLPVGGFYKDTGGKWIYVVKDDYVVRRNIKLGRKSTEYFEVLEGLMPGDNVITSSYENFDYADTLDIAELDRLHEKPLKI